MDTQKTNLIVKNESKILVTLFIVAGVLSIIFTSLVGLVGFQNAPTKNSLAASVYVCATGEALVGTNCTSTPTTSPIYNEACPSGYVAMDSVCVTYTQKVCTDYTKAIVDPVDITLCKLDPTQIVLLSEVTDSDGRQCKGNGYNFKQYNVDLPLTAPTGPILCSNAFSAVSGVVNYRFVPRTITSIKNFETTQTGSTSPVCPAGYTLVTALCSIPAMVSNCSATGEFLISTSGTCQTCPANNYCTNSTTGETTANVCPNGGVLTSSLCIAANQVNKVTYVDGCGSAYVRFDKTCAIEEIRTHDRGCSYFYASDNVNIVAVLASDGIHCSTGGSVDFANTSIVKVSDLECDGPGSGWYNYNVAYDPLVCGNSYDPNNKAAFRWLEKTFTKIVGLQKIGNSTSVCPANWTLVSGSTNCSQSPVSRRFAIVNACPTTAPNSPTGSTQLSNCTATQTAQNQSITTVITSNTASISGYVYIDFNNNGIVDYGEAPIPGVEVKLIGEIESCKNVTKTTMTDAGGKYEFKELGACAYSILETQPTNFIDGKDTAGKINEVVTGQAAQNDKITGITLLGNQNSVYNNFGELAICKLKASEYFENNECKPCPKGTSIQKLDPKSINDCIQNVTIVIADRPTIRTGGLNLLEILTLGFTISVTSIAFYVAKTNRQEFVKGWFKAK
jgi:SdrD B-like domain